MILAINKLLIMCIIYLLCILFAIFYGSAALAKTPCVFIYVTTVERLNTAIILIQDKNGKTWRSTANQTKGNKVFENNMKRVMSQDPGVYLNGNHVDGTACEHQNREKIILNQRKLED